MGVPSVRKNFDGRRMMDRGNETKAREITKVIQNVLKAFWLDVLKHVIANDDISLARGLLLSAHGRVIFRHRQMFIGFSQSRFEPALAASVIEECARLGLLEDVIDNRKLPIPGLALAEAAIRIVKLAVQLPAFLRN